MLCLTNYMLHCLSVALERCFTMLMYIALQSAVSDWDSTIDEDDPPVQSKANLVSSTLAAQVGLLCI